jgi:hypothetical protein
MPDILGIRNVKIALAEGQIIDGIQQVGLSNPIVAYETIYLSGETQGGLTKIFIIQDRKLPDVHRSNFSTYKSKLFRDAFSRWGTVVSNKKRMQHGISA